MTRTLLHTALRDRPLHLILESETTLYGTVSLVVSGRCGNEPSERRFVTR